jgi:hypothetical protein
MIVSQGGGHCGADSSRRILELSACGVRSVGKAGAAAVIGRRNG